MATAALAAYCVSPMRVRAAATLRAPLHSHVAPLDFARCEANGRRLDCISGESRGENQLWQRERESCEALRQACARLSPGAGGVEL